MDEAFIRKAVDCVNAHLSDCDFEHAQFMATQLVYCNFNILVSCPADKVTPVTSYLETKLYECGIMPSRTAYNQLELFTDSFPGNGYAFNPDYDLFLTLSPALTDLTFVLVMKPALYLPPISSKVPKGNIPSNGRRPAV